MQEEECVHCDGGGNKEIKLSVVVGQSKQVVRQLTVSAKVNKTKNNIYDVLLYMWSLWCRVR
jgi:hypothetical protein